MINTDLPKYLIHKRTTANGELNWTYYFLVSCIVYKFYQCSGLVMQSLISIPPQNLDSEISTDFFFQRLQLYGFISIYIWCQGSLVVELNNFSPFLNVRQVVLKI